MGVLNITPDSFYDGGKYYNSSSPAILSDELMNADIIDIGAESSRPYSHPITIKEELGRLSVLDQVNLGKKVLSIDSYKYDVIKSCLDKGYGMINDISAGGSKFENINLACEYNVPIVLMHMEGKPINMQDSPKYENIIDELKYFFEQRIEFAIKIGMNNENVNIAPLK